MKLRKHKPKKKASKKHIASKTEDLHGLEHEELSGSDENSSLAASSTDEDEDEGLGDGNIGRSSRGILGK